MRTIVRPDVDRCRMDTLRLKAWKERMQSKRVNYNTDEADFLQDMTAEALKPDAPDAMVVALCRYIASTG